jgi:hypothetical protein
LFHIFPLDDFLINLYFKNNKGDKMEIFFGDGRGGANRIITVKVPPGREFGQLNVCRVCCGEVVPDKQNGGEIRICSNPDCSTIYIPEPQ